jgi:hypothetical protein
MQDDLLTRLQNWYKTNCNGDWEHSWGLSIGTIDNPGFSIRINLADTSLENLEFERIIDNGDFDWIFIKVKDKVYEAHSDPSKLTLAISIFLDEIIPNYSDNNFHYQVYVPLDFKFAKVWRPVYAKMVTENILEIVEIPALKYEDIKTLSLDDITFNKEDIISCGTGYSVGQRITTNLTEMFDGVTQTVYLKSSS